MEDKIKRLETLVYNEGSFLDLLLEGQGVDVDLLMELRELLKDITAELGESDNLPRALVSALFDLNRGITVSLESYEDDEDFIKVVDLEEEITNLTAACIGLPEDVISQRLEGIN